MHVLFHILFSVFHVQIHVSVVVVKFEGQGTMKMWGPT